MSASRPSPLVAVIAVAITVAGLVLLDLMDPSQARSRPEPEPAGPAVAGAWYCAAQSTADQHETQVVASSPFGADVPSAVEFGREQNGTTTPLELDRVFPGTAQAVTLDDGLDEFAIGARWWDWPAVVSRTWSVSGAGLPTGLVSGPCAPGPSETWYVPGMSTAGGASARLYLANPFETDASVAIRFTTPAGEEAPLLLENVVVPAADVTVVDLNDHVPRQSDVGVVVEARSGRVVAEGVQFVSAAIGGVDGVALVRATPQLGATWTVPWSVTDPVSADQPTEDGTVSWIWVSNPGDDAAAVTVTLHTADGPVVPDIGDELTVEPRSIVRIDLRGLLPDDLRTAGATVRSENDVPIAVSVGSILRRGDGQTGFATQIGQAEPDPVWVVPGEGGSNREDALHLVNPGAEPALVDVALWTGAAVVRPEELTGLEVAPGALLDVALTDFLPADAPHTAFVTATQGSVVIGRSSSSLEGAVRWVVHTGVSSRLWRGGDVVPRVAHEAGLVTRLDTELGLPTGAPEEPAPEPTPEASPAAS